MKYILVSLLALILSYSYAQPGGKSVYEFLNIPTHARSVGLGGYLSAVNDSDLLVATYHPALINETMKGKLGLSYLNYYAGINAATAAYLFPLKKKGELLGSIHYLSYGNFEEIDEYEVHYGRFYAFDMALNLGYAHQLTKHIKGGVNAKLIYSDLYEWNSLGIAFDMGLHYSNPERNIMSGLLIRNVGTPIIKYRSENDEYLQPDIQLSLSRKLSKAPFRWMIHAVNLNRWNLVYQNKNTPEKYIDPITGDSLKRSKINDMADELMRHFVIGLEFVPSEKFNIRIGYNYKVRQEMKILSRTGMVGFSWGFGIRVSKFNISYGRGVQHFAGTQNMISITTSLDSFNKK